MTKEEKDAFVEQCREAKLPIPKREWRFHQVRRWRFDYALPDLMLAFECEGGVWTGGRHIHPSGFLKDMEKYNTASLLGWVVYRFTPKEARNGEALELYRKAIETAQGLSI